MLKLRKYSENASILGFDEKRIKKFFYDNLKRSINSRRFFSYIYEWNKFLLRKKNNITQNLKCLFRVEQKFFTVRLRMLNFHHFQDYIIKFSNTLLMFEKSIDWKKLLHDFSSHSASIAQWMSLFMVFLIKEEENLGKKKKGADDTFRVENCQFSSRNLNINKTNALL